MASKYIQLGPWPLGMDNVHPETHKVFQLPGQGENPARLRTAIDVDLTDEGWPSVRVGFEPLLTVEDAVDSFSFNSHLYVVTTAGIALLNGTLSSIVDFGESSAFAGVSHAGQFFWTDGLSNGRITQDGTVTNWGCMICPSPELDDATGSLPAGKYLVTGEFKDANGITHAAGNPAEITLATAGAITVNFSEFDLATTHVRLYVAGPNSKSLRLLGDVEVGDFPYDIVSLPVSDFVCWTVGLSGPLPADCLMTYRDRILLGIGTRVFSSLGPAVHLYDLGVDVVQLPEDVIGGGGLPDGFWLTTSKAAYWVSGDSPKEWKVVKQVECGFAAGSFQTSVGMLKGLGLNGNDSIVLFMSEWGLAVGMQQGQMLFPSKNRYHADVSGKRVRFEMTDDQRLLAVVS